MLTSGTDLGKCRPPCAVSLRSASEEGPIVLNWYPVLDGRSFAKPALESRQRRRAQDDSGALSRPCVYRCTMIRYLDGDQNFSASAISSGPRNRLPSRTATFASSRLCRDTIWSLLVVSSISST